MVIREMRMCNECECTGTSENEILEEAKVEPIAMVMRRTMLE